MIKLALESLHFHLKWPSLPPCLHEKCAVGDQESEVSGPLGGDAEVHVQVREDCDHLLTKFSDFLPKKNEASLLATTPFDGAAQQCFANLHFSI